MHHAITKALPIVDVLVAPIAYVAGWLLRQIRRIGTSRLPLSKRALLNAGVFPVRNHYYEPQFDFRTDRLDFETERPLPGIDWNTSAQLELLERFEFASEIADIPRASTGRLEYFLDNGLFEAGDAEFWYQLIRAVKPRRIIEIGSGNSTLLATRAIRRNSEEDPGYGCEHICIEPYEMPWLEETDVTVVRLKVEEMDRGFFSCLQANDILFIDSSHMIRPGGDVLFEYLELLPSLASGVIVHIHDIFSPRNYPKRWLVDDVRFWNEQYLLEAFLSQNGQWRIIGALNYLQHNHPDRLAAVAPFLTPSAEPASFYIQSV